LAQQGVVIYGVNYKDDVTKAQQWLQQKGNPYRFNVVDKQGRLGLDMGVTGAPETYVIDHRGFVRLRYQGPLHEAVWLSKFVPLLKQLRQEQEGNS
jgi:cytochrome c biogenesis protein CcmG/thiol:disulfide interchange protein DsbE